MWVLFLSIFKVSFVIWNNLTKYFLRRFAHSGLYIIIVVFSLFFFFLSLLAFCSEELYQKFSSMALLSRCKILSLFVFLLWFYLS